MKDYKFYIDCDNCTGTTEIEAPNILSAILEYIREGFDINHVEFITRKDNN